MPLDLKDRLTNSFQKLKDSTTLDERAASLLKPISDFSRPRTGTLALRGNFAAKQFTNNALDIINRNPMLNQGMRNISSGMDRVIRNPVSQIPLQFMAGNIEGSNLYLTPPPVSKPSTLGGGAARTAGSLVGALNPYGASGRIIRGISGATNPLIGRAVGSLPVTRGAVGLATNRIASGLGNVGQGMLMDPAINQKTTPFSAGLDFATGALFGPGQFDNALKPVAKGMDQYYQATGKKWHPEDIITLHNLEKRFNGLKVAKGGKIYDNITKIEYDKLRDDIYRLAEGYLKNDEIDAIMQKGGNDKEIFGDLFKALKDKSWENPNMIKMGFAGDAQPTLQDIGPGQRYYHQTSKKAAESIRSEGFRTDIPGAGSSDVLPSGVNLKSTDKKIRLPSGEEQLETIVPKDLKIRSFETRSQVESYLRSESREYKEIYDKINKIDRESARKADTIDDPDEALKMLDDSMDEIRRLSSKAKSIAKSVFEKEGWDAIKIDEDAGGFGSTTDNLIVFNPKKVSVAQPQPTKGDTTLNDLQKSGLVSGFAGSPPKGTKERGFVKTVRNAESTAKPVSEQVKGYYKPITNKDTLNQAQSYIDTLGWDKSKQKVLSEELTAENNAIGLELMRRAQDEGRYDEAIEVAEALSKKGTEAGQAVQAFAIWGRMTPEGMTRYAVKQIEKAKADMGAVTKLVRDLTGKKMGDIKLTMEDSKKISNLMKKANNAKSEADRMKYTKQALEVINDRIPYGVSDLVDEMRYNNMLSNPKSHLRNAYQNALNTLVTKPATLVLEGKPIGAAKYYSGVLTGLPEATNKALKTIAGEVEIKKPDLQEVRTGKLPTIWQTPTRALEAGDQFFSALIKNGMQAAGASAEDAAKAAEYTLLRTDVGAKGQGHLLSAMDTVSNWLYKAPKPVRWFVPFVRTPMNAAKQWIEFSPAGLATVPGSANQREQLAKTMVGSMAMFVGARMAAEDRVTWSAPTDPKEKQLFYASGRKPFSVRMGDKWVPLFYAGPFAAAMAFPAAVKHYQDENRTALTDSQLDKITDVSADMLKFVMGQTPLTGLNTFVKLAEGDIDYSVPKNLGFTASQLIPGTGLLNYIADVLDPIYRKPSGFAESIKSGIPGMTQDLQAYTEPTGEPSTRLPQNYVMPYDLGQANQSYEMPYQQRKQELQQNAVINQFKKQVSDQVDLGTSPASGFQPTDKLGASLATLKESEEQKERFSRSREFMQFYNQNPQAVVQSIQQLGIDPNDAVFDYVANQSVDARTPFVASMIEGIQDRNQMLGVLAGMRKEVNGNKLLSDGVIDNLHDEGIIGPNEKRMLKNLEFDKDGEIKKSSGKGKKIKVPSLISTSQLLTAFNNYMKAKTAMSKSSSSRNLSDLYAKRRQRIQNIL